MVGRVLRHRSVGTTMRGLLVWVVLAEGMARLDAADINWRSPAGGSFSSTGSWFGGVVPGTSDVAHFGLTPPPNPPALPPDPISYTVSFASNERTAGIDVLDDQVTFDLNGTTYSVGNTFGVQVGSGSGTQGRLTITDGQVRQVFAQLPVIIGQNSGNGGLAVLTAGQLHSGEQAFIGFTGVGSATVAGTGALWNHFGEITVGAQAPGTLNVNDGGFVRSTSSVVGSAGAGSAIVAGTGSKWETVGGLSVGKNATGTLNVSAGGFVGAALSFLTPEFNASGPIQIAGVTPSVIGTVNVDGAGSTLYVSDMSVGAIGVGTLNVTGGGLVQNGRLGSSSSEIVTASIGTESTGVGVVTVGGIGSTWSVAGRLGIGVNGALTGNGGSGMLRVQAGGQVTVTRPLSFSASGGDIAIGDDGALHLEGGRLDATAIDFVGANQSFFWTGGALRVGRFDGNLAIPTGGVLEAISQPIATEVFGNFSQQAADSTLAIDLTSSVPMIVHGSATLGGRLELRHVNPPFFTGGPFQTFHILAAIDEITTSFANVANGERMNIAGGFGSFRVNYGPSSALGLAGANDVVLDQFQPGADFNKSAQVTGADLVNWKAGFGTSVGATHTQGDADNDGTVDGDDFLVWQRQSGITAAAATAVPEPASMMMEVLALAGITWLAYGKLPTKLVCAPSRGKPTIVDKPQHQAAPRN